MEDRLPATIVYKNQVIILLIKIILCCLYFNLFVVLVDDVASHSGSGNENGELNFFRIRFYINTNCLYR